MGKYDLLWTAWDGHDWSDGKQIIDASEQPVQSWNRPALVEFTTRPKKGGPPEQTWMYCLYKNPTSDILQWTRTNDPNATDVKKGWEVQTYFPRHQAITGPAASAFTEDPDDNYLWCVYGPAGAWSWTTATTGTDWVTGKALPNTPSTPERDSWYPTCCTVENEVVVTTFRTSDYHRWWSAWDSDTEKWSPWKKINTQGGGRTYMYGPDMALHKGLGVLLYSVTDGTDDTLTWATYDGDNFDVARPARTRSGEIVAKDVKELAVASFDGRFYCVYNNRDNRNLYWTELIIPDDQWELAYWTEGQQLPLTAADPGVALCPYGGQMYCVFLDGNYDH